MKLYLGCLALLVLSGCSTIGAILERTPPAITSFEATQIDDSTEVLFSWNITDPDSDTLTCTISFADASSQFIENCSQVRDLFHIYDTPGTYVVQLSVTDGRNTRSTTEPVILAAPEEDPTSGAALLSAFSAQSKVGPAPLTSIFSWELEGSGPVTCTLDFGDGQNEVYENCDETSEAAHQFFFAGEYRVLLSAQSESAVDTKGVIVVVESGVE